MAKIRCFLCGGRVSGGTCTECGMPQRQHAQNYYLNESSCDNKPLTHVHNEYDSSSKNTYANREHRREKRSSYAKRERRKENGNPAAKLTAVVVVVVAILVVISAVTSTATSIAGIRGIINNFDIFEEEVSFPENIEGFFDNSMTYMDDGTYDFVMYELEETGVYHDNQLGAGIYRVGYDLPEGTYTFFVIDGEGDFTLDDWDNGIYMYEFLDGDGENGYCEIENIRLYNGAELVIYGGVTVAVSTENAAHMNEKVPNSLTETVLVPGDVPLMAGKDFPAGTYDLTLEGNSDYADVFSLETDTAILEDQSEYSYEYEEYIESFSIKDSAFYGDDWDYSNYAVNVSNVMIEEGTYIRISDPGNVLVMTPSPYVVPQEGE